MRNAYAQLYARLSLGSAFLSAVADRFGLWGPPGAPNAVWGSFGRFVEYTVSVNPYAPPALVPALAIAATVCELLFGIALVLGIGTRYIAIASAILLAIFAVALSTSVGIKKAFDFSVFTASAAAMLLAHSRTYEWSVDAVLHRRKTTNLP